jgi:carboxylesterase type B
MLRSTAIALSLYFGLASCAYNASAPTVHVKNGTYVGVHSPEYNQDYFLGMPYAQPPVGSLRFRNPAALNASWSDARPATQYSESVRICPPSPY